MSSCPSACSWAATGHHVPKAVHSGICRGLRFVFECIGRTQCLSLPGAFSTPQNPRSGCIFPLAFRRANIRLLTGCQPNRLAPESIPPPLERSEAGIDKAPCGWGNAYLMVRGNALKGQTGQRGSRHESACVGGDRLPMVSLRHDRQHPAVTWQSSLDCSVQSELPILAHWASVLSLKFRTKIAKGQMQVLRLTTPKLKYVWGPFRSG